MVLRSAVRAIPAGLDVSDIRGLGRLAFDATVGVTEIVEAMHEAVARLPGIPASSPAGGRTRGIARAVYATVTAVTRLLGTAFDRALLELAPAGTDRAVSPEREALVAALNGVLGDHLAATGNPLAITMSLRNRGRPLPIERRELGAAIPDIRDRVVVLVHGLCFNDLRWSRDGHDHGAALARDLGCTPVYVHYNTGLHVSTNGRVLSELLDRLVREWPVPVRELSIVGHSMGGLVARSASHYGATRAWSGLLRRMVFLGTPHHGATLERCGAYVHACVGMIRYTAPFCRLGRIRSAGITDLRYGNVLDEHWEGCDRFDRSAERPAPVPLPQGVACYTIAGAMAPRPLGLFDDVVGDGLVPVASALGRDRDPRRSLAIPEASRWVGRGMGHFDLLGHPDVYARLREWMDPRPFRRR
jgi:pimeloyl-ACP methyl ester carboxylesterase